MYEAPRKRNPGRAVVRLFSRSFAGGSTADVLEGFKLEWLDVGEATLRVRHGGSGPGLLLLHGHPRTHATWHQVAPLLAEGWTVVCPDLRGYGQSSKPPTTAAHEPYSKRAMARDCAALMRALGHRRYAVVGHDRGAYVAQRLALDDTEAVTHLGFLGGVPIGEALLRADARFASAWWHWFFLGQTEKPAERIISADPDAWYRPAAETMGEDAFAGLRQALHDPKVVHAMCEDYRAGLGIDRALDDADRAAGRRLTVPVLVAWGAHDDIEELWGDPTVIWRDWANDVRGVRIDAGHHLAEEAPHELAAVLRHFLEH